VPEAERPPAVRLIEVSRHYGKSGEVRAVDRVSLDLVDGEFFSLLGPSGSGKTTCLRLIAGFDRPTLGRVELHGRDVTDLPPYERDVNTVFQDYALFPHLTVADNVGYGLRIRRTPAAERDRRVADALAMVRLPEMGGRRPSELSGGQRQRIALARALVNRPRVLLLDEPLGALDLKLRQEMQLELKAIQREVGITFVFVTHDQEEALTMSDRLAVFDRGRIAQLGTPAEVYERPATRFVAGFVGSSNLFEGELARALGGAGQLLSARPEKLALRAADQPVAADELALDGTVAEAVYAGPMTRYVVRLDAGGDALVVEQNLGRSAEEALAARGRRVRLAIRREHLHAIPQSGSTEPSQAPREPAP
jgi:putative spermidine/putrescine transport system ATP-binding protein